MSIDFGRDKVHLRENVRSLHASYKCVVLTLAKIIKIDPESHLKKMKQISIRIPPETFLPEI